MVLVDVLLQMLGDAKQRVVLVSPFVKVDAVLKIVDCVPCGVPIDLITRWKPEEIARGVSDLEVWDVLSTRKNSQILLCQQLHAKCYISDRRALVGSANLTARGLGYHENSNLECAVEIPVDHEEIAQLLQAVERQSVLATHELYCMCKEAAALIEIPQVTVDVGSIAPEYAIENIGSWLPLSRYPEQLFVMYSGSGTDLSRAAQESACLDLGFLQAGPGMTKKQFNKVIYSTIIQLNFFNKIYRMADDECRRFGEYRQFTKEFLIHIGSDRSATEVWQTALRWLLYFGAAEFYLETPNYSEILKKRQIW